MSARLTSPKYDEYSTHCSQVCSTISVTLCKAGKHPEFEEDLPSPTHTRLPFVTMVVVMRTHSCHHHCCNLWTKTANINITIIDIHITASTSILSFFLATDALHLENIHHHLPRDSPQTLSSLHDCLTLHSRHLSLALHASNISVQHYERSVWQIITFWWKSHNFTKVLLLLHVLPTYMQTLHLLASIDFILI